MSDEAVDEYEPPYDYPDDSLKAASELERHNREHYEAVMGRLKM